MNIKDYKNALKNKLSTKQESNIIDFVVIELKVTELKKEYIGQIQVYMNYIDENLIEIKP